MPSTTNEVTRLLDQAARLLTSPTLINLGSVEQLLREAVVRMPAEVDDQIRHKVRLCGRLIENAEAVRPGSENSGVYGPQGIAAAPAAATRHRLQVEG
jgi:hypothetical protein